MKKRKKKSEKNQMEKGKKCKKDNIKMDDEEMIHLKQISEKEFREFAKGCGSKIGTRFRAGS